MKRQTAEKREWPAWLAPLRPDQVTRSRMRRVIMDSASPLLAANRTRAWEDVAAHWSTLLAPAAAAVAIAFGGLAYSASVPSSVALAPEPRPASVEDLVVLAAPDGPPVLLTAESEPSNDHLFAAVMLQGAPADPR